MTKVVENRFRTMPAFVAGFNRYTPSEYFIKHRDAVFNAFPDVPQALDRFEGIFKDLNTILVGSVPESVSRVKDRNVA